MGPPLHKLLWSYHVLTSTNSLFFLTLALHVFARLRCLHFQAFRPSIFCFACFQFLFCSSFSFTHRQILKKLVRRVAWFVAGMMARQQLAIADIMVPWALLQQVLQVWQLEPLHLSQVERRASSTIVLAAHSMRRSSFDWLRILCQEILFQRSRSRPNVQWWPCPTRISRPASLPTFFATWSVTSSWCCSTWMRLLCEYKLPDLSFAFKKALASSIVKSEMSYVAGFARNLCCTTTSEEWFQTWWEGISSLRVTSTFLEAEPCATCK